MRSLVDRDGLEEQIEIDSAGTGAWHVGSAPDGRAREAAAGRGIELAGRARQVRGEDFESSTWSSRWTAKTSACWGPWPVTGRSAKVRLLREFDPASARRGDLDRVPDPYYGAAGGFDEVFDLVQAACEGLLAEIRAARWREPAAGARVRGASAGATSTRPTA